MEVKSGRRRLARNRRRVGQTSTNSTGMTDNTFHLDQLFQRTEEDIIILRTRPLSTDSATRSAQSVERRAMEVARSLSRIGTQLESLAKEVLATSASVDLAKSTTLHLAKDTTQGVGYANGQPVATPPALPLSTLKHFFQSLESLCTWQEKSVLASYHEQHAAVRSLRTAGDIARLESRTFQVYVDKITEQLKQTPDSD
jgi:hypothetical protein